MFCYVLGIFMLLDLYLFKLLSIEIKCAIY